MGERFADIQSPMMKGSLPPMTFDRLDRETAGAFMLRGSGGKAMNGGA